MGVRRKYKALYEAEQGGRQEAERQRDRLRAHLDCLGPYGEAIAERMTAPESLAEVAPVSLPYPEWLSFAVYLSHYDRCALESSGYVTLRWRGRPVVWEMSRNPDVRTKVG